VLLDRGDRVPPLRCGLAHAGRPVRVREDDPNFRRHSDPGPGYAIGGRHQQSTVARLRMHARQRDGARRSASRRSDRGQEIVIEVIDEGMGVPQALKEARFERFRRGPKSQGAGLGLAIVRPSRPRLRGRCWLPVRAWMPRRGGTTSTGLPRSNPFAACG
jgi:hypothetical protein